MANSLRHGCGRYPLSKRAMLCLASTVFAPRHERDPAPRVVERRCTTDLNVEVLGPQLAGAKQRDGRSIRERAQLFHEVKNEARLCICIAVKEARVRVEPGRVKASMDGRTCQAVVHGHERIDRVEWRSSGAPVEGFQPCDLGCDDRETLEIATGGKALDPEQGFGGMGNVHLLGVGVDLLSQDSQWLRLPRVTRPLAQDSRLV